jgi:ABC-type multidrug transport system fused ATPase/permease subunit
MKFFASRKTGDIITRFSDAFTIKDIFTNIALTLIMDISMALITAVILLKMNLTLFGIIILLTVISIILVFCFKHPYKKINLEQMQQASILNSEIIEGLSGIETIKRRKTKENIFRKEKNLMELCYDGALVLPQNCVAMQEEEMMYTEGGVSVTVNSTTGGIRTRLNTIIAASLAGNVLSVAAGAVIGNVVGAVVGFILGTAWFGAILGYARSAHSKVEGFITKYGTGKACSMTSTWSLILCTGISVSV